MLRSGIVTAELWKFSPSGSQWQLLWASRRREAKQTNGKSGRRVQRESSEAVFPSPETHVDELEMKDEELREFVKRNYPHIYGKMNISKEEESVSSQEKNDERRIRKNSLMKAVGEHGSNEPHNRWFASSSPSLQPPLSLLKSFPEERDLERSGSTLERSRDAEEDVKAVLRRQARMAQAFTGTDPPNIEDNSDKFTDDISEEALKDSSLLEESPGAGILYSDSPNSINRLVFFI